ncbi:MAG: hypothetical protein NTW86_07655 [Candidatus Sumerlaeota bacterium]|nr:hypothetical protein [Candidatus Sumerlaeota bacterium]
MAHSVQSAIGDRRSAILSGLALWLCLATFAALAQELETPPPPADRGEGVPFAYQPDEKIVPDAGQNDLFSYARSKDYPRAFAVYPTDGSDPFLVSESFLALTVRDPRLEADKQLTALRGYPNMVQTQFDMTVAHFYPDPSQAFDTAFEPQTIVSETGAKVEVGQDPLAQPYVRVKLTEADGATAEFSVARQMVEPILADANLDATGRINAFRSLPFRLPEAVRAGFATMPKDEFYAAVSQEPGMQRQEFVRMRAVYAQEAKRKAELAAAGLTPTPSPSPLPTPPPPPRPQPPSPAPTAVARPPVDATPAVKQPAHETPAQAEPSAASARVGGLTLLGALIVLAGVGAFAFFLWQYRRQ